MKGKCEKNSCAVILVLPVFMSCRYVCSYDGMKPRRFVCGRNGIDICRCANVDTVLLFYACGAYNKV